MDERAKLDISILHVEDQKITRDHLKFLLAPVSREYYNAKDGLEGLEIFLKYSPDIVITDIKMPGVDGIEMAKRIKEANPQAQIIILSSLEKEAYLLDAINIGIDQFVLKDVGNNHEIMLAVERCARQKILQKQVEKQYSKIQKLSQAVEQSGTMILIYNSDGIIEYSNKSFFEHTKLPYAKVIGARILDIRNDSFFPLWEEAIKNKHAKGENMLQSPDGEEIWVLSNISQIISSDGKQIDYVEVVEDITDRKKTIEALNQAKEAAQSANKAKSSFLANMSHELRTPLNGVIGMASLLMSTQLDPKQQEYITLLKSAGEALLKIINDILDISKIEAGRFEIEARTFDLHSSIKAAADFYVISAQSKNLAFSCEIDPNIPKIVIGDKGRLNQAITNVIGNAIKFTEVGKIDFKVSLLNKSGDKAYVRFVVADTGVGVPEADLPMLFEKFTQADPSYTRKKGGTGLGLAITKELVELMGGKIWAESSLGFGSKFIFEIPFTLSKDYIAPEEKSSIAPIKLNLSATENIKTLKILLAEDNLINQKLIIEALGMHKHSVKAVFNGKEAFEESQSGEFDIVLMDLEMPVMDGLEASRRIRIYEKENKIKRLPIIAITAHTGLEAQQRCLAAGMDSFVRKPVNFDALLSAIENIMLKEKPAESFKRPSVDLSILVDGLGGNEIVVRKIISETITLMPNELKDLRKAFDMKDIKQIRFLAHKFKSALGNLGAFKAKQVAEKIEKFAAEENIAYALDQYFDFEQEINNIIAYLNRFLNISR